MRNSRRHRSKAKDAEIGVTKLIASINGPWSEVWAFRCRLQFGSWLPDRGDASPVLGAAELPQASLDLLNGRPALCFLECV